MTDIAAIISELNIADIANTVDIADGETQFDISLFTDAHKALEYYKPDPADTPIDEEDYLKYMEGVEEATTIAIYSDRLVCILDCDMLFGNVELLRGSILQLIKYNCTREHLRWGMFDDATDMLTEAGLYDAVFDDMVDTMLRSNTKNVFRTVNIVSLLYTQRNSARVIAKYDPFLDELLDSIYTPIGYGENMHINAIIFQALVDLDFPCVFKALNSKSEETRKGTLRSELAVFHTLKAADIAE